MVRANLSATVSMMQIRHAMLFRMHHGVSTIRGCFVSERQSKRTDQRDSKGRTGERNSTKGDVTVSRDELIHLLNEDLSREYQAIIAYVVYSQVLKGAEYMSIAKELEQHASEELGHAVIIAKQIDYLGGMPTVVPKPVRTSEKPTEMLRFDLQNETETIHNYRQRVRQCEALGEYALAEHIREILMQEQEHQIDLATALGVDVPNMSDPQ
jgi:bacterioferritin